MANTTPDNSPQAEPTAALTLLVRMLADEITARAKPPEPPRECMTIGDVAEFIGVSKGKVYQLIRDDGLPTRRVGCAQRVIRSELLAWLQSRPAGEGEGE